MRGVMLDACSLRVNAWMSRAFWCDGSADGVVAFEMDENVLFGLLSIDLSGSSADREDVSGIHARTYSPWLDSFGLHRDLMS